MLDPIPLPPRKSSKCSQVLPDQKPEHLYEKQTVLMDIKIKIYSLSGVKSYVDTNSRNKRFSTSQKERKGKERPSYRRDGAAKTRKTPVTAVVSCEEYVGESNYPVETYLPSQTIPRPRTAQKGQNQTVPWDTSSRTSSPRGFEQAFLISRVMQRQLYVRKERTRIIESYLPETVNIKVGIACGKDVITMGTASIAITGDEECETTTHVPVRLIPYAQKRFRRQRKKERTRDQVEKSFPTDPSFKVSFTQNTALKVGVQARVREKLAHRKYSRKLNNSLHERSLVIELNDENSLLDLDIESKTTRDRNPAKPTSSTLTSYFCNSTLFPAICQAPADNHVETTYQTPSHRRVSSAVVLPPFLMSSISESTLGSH